MNPNWTACALHLRDGRCSGMGQRATRSIGAIRWYLLRAESQRNITRCLVDSLPCDADHPIEVVVREPVKARGLDANARMWVGPLKDIAEQCYVNGRTYSAEVWHEHFKID